MGSSNAEKCGDHQRKKFFINNSAGPLILFKEEHQGGPILKLHVPLGYGKKWHKNLQKREFSLKQKNNLQGGISESCKNHVGLSIYDGLMETVFIKRCVPLVR